MCEGKMRKERERRKKIDYRGGRKEKERGQDKEKTRDRKMSEGKKGKERERRRKRKEKMSEKEEKKSLIRIRGGKYISLWTRLSPHSSSSLCGGISQ